MAAPALSILRPEHCVPFAALARQVGKTALLPLLRAGVAGRIGLVLHLRGTRIGRDVLDGTHDVPTAVVLGDDYRSTGPGGWPQAVRLLRWAEVIILHGAGAEAVHHEMAAVVAVLRRRSLIVETSSVHIDAWVEFTKQFARPETGVSVVAMAAGLAYPRTPASPPGWPLG
jgi:hypothetical protein